MHDTSEGRGIPRATQALAAHAAEDMLLLHNIQKNAPPEIAKAIKQVLGTMGRLSVHVYAILQEGPECAARVEKRVEEYEQQVQDEMRQRQDLMQGAVLREIFSSSPPSSRR